MQNILISPGKFYLTIRAIQKKEGQRFTIEWSDGKLMEYRLSEIQKCCPCALCCVEGSGVRRNDAPVVDDEVGALRIASVGRYALQIVFTSGCSKGIYSFALLRRL